MTACGTEMVKGDPMIVPSVAFTRRAVAGIAMRKGDIPGLQNLVVVCNILWVGGDPHVFG